ncbi:MAG: nitroreductase family protein [Thermodesulfobacteriota bacterium]
MIHIDPERCKRDFICVMECPTRILEQKAKDQPPVLVRDGESLCIRCGHCVAVCPHEAFSHRDIPQDQVLPIRPEHRISIEQATQFLKSRRSIRAYRKRPVDREELMQVLDVARFAPSGHNNQPVSWIVVYNTDEVRRMTDMVADWMRQVQQDNPTMAALWHFDRILAGYAIGMDGICRHSPHLLIAHADKSDVTAPNACVIAAATAELAASAMGLGVCWAGFFLTAALFWPPLHEALGFPKGHLPYAALMVGYPKVVYHRIPPRKPLSVTWKT